MTIKLQETIALADLAREIDINKSKLNYYAWKGLIKPIKILGKTMIFNKRIVKKQIRVIKREKEKGKKLKEIKIIISKIK